MKKHFILLTLLFSLSSAKSQYVKLYDFGSTNGNPFGGINATNGDSVVYGITNCIYSIKPNGTGFRNLHNFSPDGSHGSLLRINDTLYGMTMSGGPYGLGRVFSYKIANASYTTLYDFGTDSTDGYAPEGSLISFGNKLFGMTYWGGKGHKGTLFSINLDGSGYIRLHDFGDSTMTGDGEHPLKDLVYYNGKLYGMTVYGGTNGVGTVFSINTNGTGYTKILDFNNANGNMPMCSLVESGGVLFGGASGGPNGKGLIFSIKPDGSNYKDLYDFNGTPDGQVPSGITLVGGIIYGGTMSGGANTYGTIFSLDTSGAGFQNLFNFAGSNGIEPRAPLSVVGTTLYGTTVNGGIYSDGVIFSLQVHPPAVPICMVTVDDSSHHNIILWEKPASTIIDSFIVYREITTNNYLPIGALPYSALSQFSDTTSTKYFPFTGDPNTGTYRYKLQTRDIYGNTSNLSPYHNTIFVTQNGGTFSWNQYEIEGSPTPLSSISAYILYRDDNSTGAWHQVVGVAGTQTSVTDPNFASYPNASWRIETMWNITCTPTFKTTSSYSTSKSNIKGAAVGIDSYNKISFFNLYPNPAKYNIHFNSDHKLDVISLYNGFGELIMQQRDDNTSGIIDISNLPSGIYFVQVKSGNEISNRKLIKE